MWTMYLVTVTYVHTYVCTYHNLSWSIVSHVWRSLNASNISRIHSWEEKEESKQQDSPNPKRMKETIANSNRCKKPAKVRTSRCTLRIGNRTSRDDSPSGDSQPSSDKESMEHEDYGKCNRTTRCTLY